MPAFRLTETPWTELPDNPLLLIPIGSTEQHGPHLPFSVDSIIAQEVATSVADLLADTHHLPVVLAPPVSYGASGEHQGYPGTLSIGHEALFSVLVELVRSASLWAKRTIFINGHGGNVQTLKSAVSQMQLEGHDVTWYPSVFENATDAHAGFDETSVMLATAPSTVNMSKAQPGNTRPLSDLLPQLKEGGLLSVTESGVLGDPSGANQNTGQSLLVKVVSQLVGKIAHAE